MQTKLQLHFNSANPDTKLDLTDSQIQLELNNLTQNKNDYLFVLYALEQLPHKFNYEHSALSQLRISPKYSIFNIRILRLLKCDIKYIKYIFDILKILKIENKNYVEVNMNKLKVSTDVAKSYKFVEFVRKKCLKLLIKCLRDVSNSVGFPEVAYWIVKELEKIEGCEECVVLIKRQKKYVEDARKGVNVFDKISLMKVENEIKKIDHQIEG